MRNRFAVVATALSIFIFLSYLLLPSSSPSSHPSSTTFTRPQTPATNLEHTAAAAAVQQEQKHGASAGLAGSAGGGGEEAAVGGAAGGKEAKGGKPAASLHVKPELLKGDVIMPKLGNETIKQELGRASWKLLHTMLARYPVAPTPDEREALHSYIMLFGRLYPCGECAEHFQLLLAKYPPQTSSRTAASQWGCYVHNEVNERLKKPLFDCSTVTEHYKCGCADAEDEGKEGEKDKKEEGGDKSSAKTNELVKENVKAEEDEEEGKTPAVKTPKKSGTKTLEENVEESVKNGAKIEIERQGPINGG